MPPAPGLVYIATTRERIDAALNELTFTGGENGGLVSRFIDDCIDAVPMPATLVVPEGMRVVALPKTHLPPVPISGPQGDGDSTDETS